jgi:hypothetical protein
MVTLKRWLWVFVTLASLSGFASSQEIEARLYSNVPIDYNFLGVGFNQVRTSKNTINTELLSYNRTFDVFGQSGKVNVVLPYAELHGTTTVGKQAVSGSAQGLTDPIIRLAANLYGAPALTLEEFKHYRQDLIVGVNLAASIPWGEYNSNQLFNVGANRSFIQPGLGASQAVGPWRYELSGDATYFTDNNQYRGGNVLSQHPLYSTTGHVIYNFPSTAWLSADVTYFSGGQSFVNGLAVNNRQESWLMGATLSIPVNAHNAIKLHAADGSLIGSGPNYTMMGVAWQFRWGDGP